MFHAIASRLDRLGLRRPLAVAASLAYPRQSFSVDDLGNWVNQQVEYTIVSPTIHTAAFADIRAWVLETWCHGYTPRRGDVVVDVGAGIGEEALVFSRLVGPSGRIVAIEAHPATFACLASTVQRSGLTNVEPVECALGESDGSASISTGNQHLANSIMAGGDHIVAKRSLDSLAAELGLDRIDFLRMNIEGAERLAIQGMTKCIDDVRNVSISCHDFVADSTGDDSFRSKAQMRAFLKDSGFKLMTRSAENERPWVGDYLFGSRV